MDETENAVGKRRPRTRKYDTEEERLAALRASYRRAYLKKRDEDPEYHREKNHRSYLKHRERRLAAAKARNAEREDKRKVGRPRKQDA